MGVVGVARAILNSLGATTFFLGFFLGLGKDKTISLLIGSIYSNRIGINYGIISAHNM